MGNIIIHWIYILQSVENIFTIFLVDEKILLHSDLAVGFDVGLSFFYLIVRERERDSMVRLGQDSVETSKG